MDEQLRPIIDRYREKIGTFQAEIERLTNEMNKAKIIVNQLLTDNGENTEFEDISIDMIDSRGNLVSTSSPILSSNVTPVSALPIAAGDFFNRPLAKAVKTILEIYKKPTAFSNILIALRQGSYPTGKGKVEENRIRLTMLKNTTNFVLVDKNNDLFGLKLWYPNLKKDKRQKGGNNKADKPEHVSKGKSNGDHNKKQ